MDSISEQSPLAPCIFLWDRVELFLDDYPRFLRTLCFTFAYFVFFGGLRNGFLTLVFFCWMKRSQLQPALFILVDGTASFKALGATAVAWFSFYCLQWLLSETIRNQDSFSRPYLIPARTTHTRLFPKKHSFSYSYLLVGIPVGLQGNINGIVSADVSRLGLPKAWYDVDPADYLERGSGHLGLRRKLDNYLESQGVAPSDYPYAYLVTAARFLGYHFNPVSFWYLYSEDKVLSAIILEVNNTFDERRPYFVTRDLAADSRRLPDPARVDCQAEMPRATIKNSWEKDFHVSPFNSRKGSYSLLAADPLGRNLRGFRGVDITINLSSSKGHSKLVARLFSEGDAVDPSTMGPFQKLGFLFSWFWVGFATLPRIVKEAAVLFFKRQLHVWYRPEPLQESLARHADTTELVLEGSFREYLRSLVKCSPSPLIVKYIPSGVKERAEETFMSPNATQRASEREEITIKVLTPSFYSRFVGYAHDIEAIFCELAESCTIWVDRPDVLPKIFMKKPSPPLHANTMTDFITFKLIQTLRQRPQAIKRPMTSAEHHATPSASSDIRCFRISSMDAFILSQRDSKLKKAYGAAVIRLFLADRFVFGHVQVLELMETVWHVGSAWTIASILAGAASNMNATKTEQPG